MSRRGAQANGVVEDASPPRKRIKTEQQNQDTVILSIEELKEGNIETCVRDLENPTSCIGARHTSSPSPGTGDAGSLPVALPSPSLHGAVVTLHGLSSANGRTVGTPDQSTRQPSWGGSITSAFSDDREVSVDFAKAPSDPEKLALWVAEHIKLFFSEKDSSEPAEAEKRRRSRSHAPGAKLREKNDKGRTFEELANLEMIRELGRKRKANWRKGQTETNKDNDLRCRVTKRAKDIFGGGPSSEKSIWMTNECEKRKEKRKFKEHRDSESRFTGFNLPLDLAAKLFKGGNDKVDNEEVNAAGILLANTLHIVTSLEGPPSNADAAYALKAALSDPKIGTQPFVKALGILSKDLSVVCAIVAPSGPSSKASSRASSKAYPRASTKASSRAPSNPPTSRPFTAMSAESNYSSRSSSLVARPNSHGGILASGIQGSSSPTAHQFQLRGGIALETNLLPDRDRKLQAIGTAIEVLEQMVDENPMARFPPFGRPPPAYVTPYETPYKTPYETPYPNKGSDQNQNINANGKVSQTTTSPKTTGESGPDGNSALGVDKKTFTSDATDAKGHGKPTRLEEEQADVLLRFAGVCSLSDVDDGDETSETDNTSKVQPDTDVDAIIEHIYRVLDSRDAIVGTAQGVALRSVISDIGIVKNTIIPQEQSAATALLYKLLSIRAQGSFRLAAGIFATAPGGAFGQYQGNVVPQHPGGAFPHVLQHPGGVHHHHGSIVPPPLDLIPHPGGVFTSPRYPGGYFVPHNSGFFPPPPPPPGTLGDGSRGNPIILPNPVPHPQARQFVPSSMPPPPIPPRIGTARGRTVEEAKKVRDYGFPPLPGSRPGVNLQGTKRRLG